ncbi:aminotransferase class I/II-fold pyridoxal phosphate-dependent enzyme [Paenibacillus campi]|uniref:aminotransferase class I/II-fold pyridoxal phosphate-dependent enzyme n=1 Tax=Paenibacillus campi TaxID=3106031 RepID=UPI002AFF3954|nr:aminotransferase class I/II-fold pyridoxal phosphate-dependent enzyme [Paenibacillus sp. SGZ-1014]
MNNNKFNKQELFSQPHSQHQQSSADIHANVRAPLYERLIQYARSGNRSYHVPGHKNGAAFTQLAEQSNAAFSLDYVRQLLRLDVTEIEGTDDLHHPEGVIQEGQQLAARCFGAEETYWLVGGSTSGNLALLLSVCQQPGDLIIVQRNVHKSVIHGLMLAGAQAVFLAPEIEITSGLAVVPSAETVGQALERYPNARAVLLTSPNYYGIGTDLTAIARHCHERHIPLLVDEAHGAHYGHHPRFPQSALAAGADGVVQSTHKMLSAMTMGAMLHVQGKLLDRELLRQRLTMIQSSSPSYPIMASLDLSRYWLDYAGSNWFEAGLAARDYVVEQLATSGRYSEVGSERTVGDKPVDAGRENSHLSRFAIVDVGSSAVGHMYSSKQSKQSLSAQDRSSQQLESEQSAQLPYLHMDRLQHCNGETVTESYIDPNGIHIEQDPFKLVLYDRTGQLSGQQLQKQLERHGCIPEMSDERYVVLVFSVGSQMEDATRLLDALVCIAADTAVERENYGEPQSLSLSQTSRSDDLVSTPSKRVLSSSSLDANKVWVSSLSEPVHFHLKPILEQHIETIPLEQASERKCAEMIIPYPPGIPVLYAGETISVSLHQRLLQLRQHNLKIQGAADASLATIQVYRADLDRAGK